MSQPDIFGEMARGERPLDPFDAHMGFRIDQYGDGVAVLSAEVGPERANPTGVVHGGVMSALADSAMAFALMSALGPQATVTNVDLNVDLMRPVWAGTILARGSVAKFGRTVCFTQCEITGPESKVIARARSKFIVLAKDRPWRPPA